MSNLQLISNVCARLYVAGLWSFSLCKYLNVRITTARLVESQLARTGARQAETVMNRLAMPTMPKLFCHQVKIAKTVLLMNGVFTTIWIYVHAISFVIL